MLRELTISNFAIIDHQQISFGSGLNVISGETGAGKSIILSALELILGAKSSTQTIRTGCEELEVEALFDLSSLDPSIVSALPEIAQGDELLIHRSLNRSGRSKVFLNGRLASVSLLVEVAARLINICGQGQHIQLLDPQYHLDLIDVYAGNHELLPAYRTAFDDWRLLQRKVKDLEEHLGARERRREDLMTLLEEAEPLGLSATSRDQAESLVKRLSSAEQIIALVQDVNERLGGESGILEQVQGLAGRIQEISRLDATLTPQADLFHTARAEMIELESQIASYGSKISLDEDALEDARERLAQIAKLERKYKTDCQGLVRLVEAARIEMQELGTGELLPKMKAESAQKLEIARGLAGELSGLRAAAAKRLSRAVEKELAELNMAEAKLTVRLNERESGLNEYGIDEVEFLISTNKGEDFKALKQVASGGELSRITLVLKKVLGEKTGVNVLVFDEVDTGVSGGVARAVGEKLKALAADDAQVICITHLPQVASLADHHFLVTKKSGSRTVSIIKELEQEERVDEIARMLSGYKVTDASRKSAKELLGAR